jgi:hypothetical protein
LDGRLQQFGIRPTLFSLIITALELRRVATLIASLSSMQSPNDGGHVRISDSINVAALLTALERLCRGAAAVIAAGFTFDSFSILANPCDRGDHLRIPGELIAWLILKNVQSTETKMKTTLILAALSAALSVASTQSFAQNFVNYPSAYGNSQPTIIARTPTPVRGSRVAPTVGRFTASDFGYQASPRPERLHSPGR